MYIILQNDGNTLNCFYKMEKRTSFKKTNKPAISLMNQVFFHQPHW